MREFFKNCLDVIEEDGWYLPVRLTEKQYQSYSRREPMWNRAYNDAGIAVAFRTTATKVEITYKITENARDYAHWDVVVDGVFVKSENHSQEKDTFVLDIPGNGERDVEIFLPHLARVWISDIKPNAAIKPLPAKEKFWLFLGDSITQGMASLYPSQSYPVLAARWMDCDFLNMGVCGGKFFAGDLDSDHRKADIITVAMGTNDWKQAGDEETFRATAREYIARLVEVYPTEPICAILPIWRSDVDGILSGMTFDKMHDILKEEYGKYPRIRIINGLELVPNLPEYFGDRFAHPNEFGFVHYAMNLCRVSEIKEALNLN